MPTSNRNVWLAALTWVALAGASPLMATQAAREAPEYDVKGALLFNFAKTIQWPEGAFAGAGNAFRLCLFGGDPFGDALSAAEGMTAQDRTVTIQRISNVSDVSDCQLLFVPSNQDERLAAIMASIAGTSVITVGESDRFSDMGGMIQFVTVDDRLQFVINAAAASNAGVSIDPALLEFSRQASAARDATTTWYQHYARAEAALQAANWELAIQRLNLALEKKGDSGSRVPTEERRTISYFPYMKLGLAYYQLGQLDAAIQAFETEERLGAVAESGDDMATLNRLRSEVDQVRRAAMEQEQQRIGEIVSNSLEQANALEASGQLNEAMTTVGRALAVAPENLQALAAMDRLRSRVAEQQAQAELASRVAALVTEGNAFMEQGRYSEASRVFRQANSLQPSVQNQAHLDRAQSSLKLELEQRDSMERVALAEESLREAEELVAAGEREAALDRLQAVLALAPDNQRAIQIQTELIRASEAAGERQAREESVRKLLDDAQTQFNDRLFEESLATANRALALEPGHPDALGIISRAYGEINRRLLGGGARGNIPPAIRFADSREELEDGSRAQRIDNPDFRLTGVIIDDSPVTVALYGIDESPLPVSSDSQPLGEYYVTSFDFNHQLAAGPSTYRLVATDAEGLSSSSEYAVMYRQPFYRSIWFFSVLGLALVSSVVALQGRRMRTRHRLRQRRYNPYVAGAPILDEDLFFGRQRLLDQVLQTVHNNSLLLYGERRIGKTSFQHALKRRLKELEDPRYEFYPVYVDLQGVPEEKFFSTVAEDMFHDLEHILENVTPDPSIEEEGSYGYRELVRDIRKIIEELKTKSAKQIKLVLLIDEVDELNDYNPKINQRLRSLFMKSFAENLAAVVSGVSIKKHWEREGSPWYNFFEEIRITPFQRSDAVELIEKPVRELFTFEDGVVDRIIERSDCKPYPIQKLCIALVNRLHDQDRRRIRLADLEAVEATVET